MEEDSKKEEVKEENLTNEETKEAKVVGNEVKQKTVNFFKKIVELVKEKWILVVSILAAVLVIIGLICMLSGGKAKSIKKFISGMNEKNANKIVDSIDFAGSDAWKYSYDEDDFNEEDYKEFINDYKDVNKEDIEKSKKDAKETFKDGFDSIKDTYKSYKFKIEKIKSTKKLGKDLYAIDAKISIYAKPKDKEDKELDETKVISFIIYKGKIVYSSLGLI